MPAVGWIGLGAIGLPMAQRAAAAGWDVVGFDTSPERCEAAAGIQLAHDPEEVGRAAGGLVACVVRSAGQVREVLLGPGGALTAAPASVGIVMSSIGAEAMSGLAAEAAARDLVLLDAPLLGNPATAAAGELTIVVSGDVAARDRARPLLDDLARTTVDLGDAPGAAQAMKVVSQLLQVVGMVTTFEGVELARRQGLREEDVLAVVAATEPSWTTDNWDYARDLWQRADPETSLGLFEKDLAAAISDGRGRDLELPLTAEALRRIRDQLEGGRR